MGVHGVGCGKEPRIQPALLPYVISASLRSALWRYFDDETSSFSMIQIREYTLIRKAYIPYTHTLSLIRQSKSPQRDVRHSISIQWTIEVLYSTVSFILHVLPRHSWSVRCILIWIQGNFHVRNLLPHVLTGYYTTSFGDRSWCHHTSSLVLLPQ